MKEENILFVSLIAAESGKLTSSFVHGEGFATYSLFYWARLIECRLKLTQD